MPFPLDDKKIESLTIQAAGDLNIFMMSCQMTIGIPGNMHSYHQKGKTSKWNLIFQH
jgi:hypothetical protein